jgi:hypothetical protein
MEDYKIVGCVDDHVGLYQVYCASSLVLFPCNCTRACCSVYVDRPSTGEVRLAEHQAESLGCAG